VRTSNTPSTAKAPSTLVARWIAGAAEVVAEGEAEEVVVDVVIDVVDGVKYSVLLKVVTMVVDRVRARVPLEIGSTMVVVTFTTEAV